MKNTEMVRAPRKRTARQREGGKELKSAGVVLRKTEKQDRVI